MSVGVTAWEISCSYLYFNVLDTQVAPVTHWSELEVLVLVVCAEKKSVSSTAGMQTTVATSSLIEHRARSIVPMRMKEMEEAILNRDFQTFARLTMQVCGQNT